MEIIHDLWHLAFANLVQHRAPPNFLVQSEVRLTIEPQRADLLLLRRLDVARQDHKAEVLRTLWPWLGRITVLECKSPVDSSFARGDLLRLHGYGTLYATAHLQDLPRRVDLTLALVLPAITLPFLEEVAWMGGHLVPLGRGYRRIDGLVYTVYVAVTDKVSEAEQDEFLALFSRRKAKPGPATRWLQQWMKDTKMKQPNIEEIPGYEEMFQKLVEAMPLEKRLAGLAPEDVLANYCPEQRVAGLPPEQRLVGLSRDQQALALPIEVLRLLPRDYIDSLSSEVREELWRRLQRASH